MEKISAVLFDFDGVLVDSEPIHHEAWSVALSPFGITIDDETYRQHFIGIEDYGAIRWVASRYPDYTFEELWATFPRKQEVFLDRVMRNAWVPEDTAELLGQLKNGGYLIGVVSSSAGAEVWPVLERQELRPFFDVGVFAEDVTRRKPHPDPYLKALNKLGGPRALVLEDSQAGIASATAAGCEVIRVTEVSKMAAQVREHLGLGNS
ncbi:MAG: HAD family phosphatase [Bryobacterales bacterium]|nr:HAD family phosphatase [Bryobacterales bacterium]